jgi:hypothetical protein
MAGKSDWSAFQGNNGELFFSFSDRCLPLFSILHYHCFVSPYSHIFMAEAIGLGSSVVAFIGLAGQVAQGCQYIRTLLDDIRDASEDLQSLRTEVKIFQLTLETFRNTLEEIADSGVAVEADGQALATKLALSYSEEALELLQGLLARRKDTGRIWGKIRFASGKSKCAKHVSRIERAKGYIEAAHAGILL